MALEHLNRFRPTYGGAAAFVVFCAMPISAGCTGDDSGKGGEADTGLSVELFFARLSAGHCEHLVECTGAYEDVDACLEAKGEQVVGECPEYSSTIAAECLDIYTSWTCDEWLENYLPEECTVACHGSTE